MTTKCETGYHSTTDMRYCVCVLDAEHEGPHKDDAGHLSAVIDKGEMQRIDREIKARLISNNDSKPAR